MTVAKLLPRVAVFRTVFPGPSEGFIPQQSLRLTRYAPQFLTRTDLGSHSWPIKAIGTSKKGKVQQYLWTLTRNPRLFPIERSDGVSLVHAHFAQDAVMALPIAQMLDIPLLTTFHGADITTDIEWFRKSGKPTHLWYVYKERELQERGAAFVAVSKFIAGRLIERGYAPEKVRQIYIGVDTERFSPGDRREERPQYLLCVGRHVHKKGLVVLLHAFAKVSEKFPKVELWQVGFGPLTATLKALARQLGIRERVRFLGTKSQQDVLELMRNALTFVLPSETADSGDCEGLGLVFNEASACGIPIIATDHGGIPEAVIHGQTGLLSPEKDIDALADHIDLLLADKSLGERLGKQGRELVCDVFDIRKQTLRLESVYDEFVGMN